MTDKNLQKNNLKRNIPGTDKILEHNAIKEILKIYRPDLVKTVIKNTLKTIKEEIDTEKITEINENSIIQEIKNNWVKISKNTFKPIINATGIVLHTNISRAPLGTKLFEELEKNVSGYSNLEFNLETGKRLNRNYHISEKIKLLTGADDAIAVNNNAAAIMLIMHAFAKNKEVIVSRGELIEIGESFRLHEIMETSGALIKEVGTTNKTKITDYQKAINKNTALIIKAHKSNYTINGFTEEVSIVDLSKLCQEQQIPFIYDLGSGLLTNPFFITKINEPFAEKAISQGADIVTFSGDKLLGGPQCGIIAGKKELLAKLRKNPMLRALRIDKLSYAALANCLNQHLLLPEISELPIIKTLRQKSFDLKIKAENLSAVLHKYNIKNITANSKAQCGGGTLPEIFMDSYAVEVQLQGNSKRVFDEILNSDNPILAILRKGKLLLDIFCIDESDFEVIAKTLRQCIE